MLTDPPTDGEELEPIHHAGCDCMIGHPLDLAADRVDMSVEGFTIERLDVVEVDNDGLMVRTEVFEPDEHARAHATLDQWYAESLAPDERAVFELLLRGLAAQAAGDEAGLRSVLATDFVATDHQTAGAGTLGPDEWIDLQLGFSRVTSGFEVQLLAIHRLSPSGYVFQIAFTDDPGNRWEYLVVASVRNGETKTGDFYPLTDFDTAIARFEKLSNPEV